LNSARLPLSFIPPPSNPGVVSTDLIFPFTYMCTQYLHYIHLSIFFPPARPPPHWYKPPQIGLVPASCSLIFFFVTLPKFYFFSFIHMCIQCLGHFSPLPPTPSHTYPTPPSLPHLLATTQKLFCPYL
jgi:hypothetical protein